MKVSLLHAGGYAGGENVNFPAEVEATVGEACVYVPWRELAKVGFKGEVGSRNPLLGTRRWEGWTFVQGEYEEVEGGEK